MVKPVRLSVACSIVDISSRCIDTFLIKHSVINQACLAELRGRFFLGGGSDVHGVQRDYDYTCQIIISSSVNLHMSLSLYY